MPDRLGGGFSAAVRVKDGDAQVAWGRGATKEAAIADARQKISKSQSTEKKQTEPAQQPMALEDMDEAQLRERMRTIAKQAKARGGRDTRLTNARREVEKVLNAKIKERENAGEPTATQPNQQSGAQVASTSQQDQPGAVRGGVEGTAADTAAGQSGDVRSTSDAGTGRGMDANTPATVASTDGSTALTGADGKPKWFSSAEKAQAHIDKKSLTGYTVTQIKPNRFELHRDVSLTDKGDTVGGKGLTLVHGSGNPSMTVDDVQIIRPEGQKQGKKGRVYGGFYGTSEQDAAQAEGYAGMMGGTPTVYNVHVRPGTKIYRKEGDITRLSENTINDLVSQGYGVVVGTDPRGRTEYAVIDKSAIERLSPRSETKSGETKRDMPSGTLTNEGAKSKTPVNPRTNRAKKLVGDVGEIVSPDGDVGYVKAGGQYQITRIEKNGTVHVMNRETSGSTTITPAELERARSRNVNWTKTDVPTAVAQSIAKSAPAETNAQQTAGSTSELAATTGAETIPYRTVAFDQAANNGAGGKVESSGTSPVINFGGRMMVLVRMGGRKIPFYLSTGKGGKADVPDGKWYPFFGIGADGWINKTGGKDMTTYYGSEALRQKAEELDRVLGDIRNDETVPKVAATGSHIDAINASFPNATENGRSDTLTKVQQSIADVVGGVAKSATAQANEQQAATEQYVAERVMSQEEVTLSELRKHTAQQGSKAETASNDGAKAEAGKSEAETAAKDADRFAENKLFTADKVAAARARMKSKFGQLNSGLDPELLIDGMTIAGAYIESGVRKFSDYARAMVDDFGDGVKPYLLSFWEGARNYPGLNTEGMSGVAESAAAHKRLLTPADSQTTAVGEIVEKPTKRTRKTGQKGDLTLTQDFGVDHIDGYGENTSGRETGSDLKDEFLKNGRAYLNAVADLLENVGFTPSKNAKGKFVGAVNVNAAGDAVSGDITLAMDGPNGTGIYMNVSGSTMRGMVPTTVSGVAIMYRATKPDDKYGSRSTNQWAPVDLSANDLATLVAEHAEKIAQRDAYTAEQQAKRSQARPTSGLDDMVSNFDTEVSNNGTATELDQPGESALGGVSADAVQPAAEVRETGRSPAASRDTNGRGNEPAGAVRDDRARSVGDDTRAVSVPAAGSEPAGGRGANAERSRAQRDNGDAAGRGRVRPAAGVTAQEKPADLFTINPEENAK
jgi:hypothetical protein